MALNRLFLCRGTLVCFLADVGKFVAWMVCLLCWAIIAYMLTPKMVNFREDRPQVHESFEYCDGETLGHGDSKAAVKLVYD